MNNKGRENQGILIILIVLLIFAIVGYFSLHFQYGQQFKEGRSILDSLTITPLYEKPLPNETTVVFISALINGSAINKKTEIISKYIAYKWDRSNNLEVSDRWIYSNNSIKMPFYVLPKEINTVDVLTKLGNNALLCIQVSLTYRGVNNLLGLFGDYPKKEFKEECKNIAIEVT